MGWEASCEGLSVLMSLWYNPSLYISPRCQAQQGWDGGDKWGGIWGEKKDALEDRLGGVHRSILTLQGRDLQTTAPTNLTTLLKNYPWLFGTSRRNRAKLRVIGPPPPCPNSPHSFLPWLYVRLSQTRECFLKTSFLHSFTYSFIRHSQSVTYAKLCKPSCEPFEGRVELCFVCHCSPCTSYKL